MAVSVRTIGIEALISQLNVALARSKKPIIAFDADGTLWSGDISDDVFLHCVTHELLRPEARLPLCAFAREHGIEPQSEMTSSQLAALLFEAYETHRLPELDAFAMMAWCYVGFTVAELQSLSEQVLAQTQWPDRINPKLLAVLDWLRANDVDAWVVSASPKPILEVAANKLGFARSSLIGTEPNILNGTITAKLRTPVHYGDGKVQALLRNTTDSELLAAFGDSAFDIALLTAATFGVAVDPKPELFRALADRPTLVHLI